MSGFAECELAATSWTEKSEATKACISARKAARVSTNWMTAAGAATRIQSAQPRCAPTIGTTICTSATRKATISATCPSSTTMSPPAAGPALWSETGAGAICVVVSGAC